MRPHHALGLARRIGAMSSARRLSVSERAGGQRPTFQSHLPPKVFMRLGGVAMASQATEVFLDSCLLLENLYEGGVGRCLFCPCVAISNFSEIDVSVSFSTWFQLHSPRYCLKPLTHLPSLSELVQAIHLLSSSRRWPRSQFSDSISSFLFPLCLVLGLAQWFQLLYQMPGRLSWAQ